MNEIRGMYLCNSLSQAKMRKQKKHRDKQRHNKNTVQVKCEATLNRPSQHSPAAAECASFEQLETQR